MVTIIIPALNEKYLQQTIDNVLENAEGDIEIIAICDGYWPDPSIKDHPDVRMIHNTIPRGQRHSINDAARIAQGKFIMKLDAHCAVDKGFDAVLARDCEYDMTMIPRMYNLDHETWLPKKHKRTDYMFIGLVDGNLRAQYYAGSTQRQPRKKEMIDDTMCCMGPCFFMHKERFWELGGCDEDHGHWGQQGVEVACKAWLSGGRLVVNKNTWFAHWFRGHHIHESGRKGFPYQIRQTQINKARAHSNDLWQNNKWPLQKRDFAWLLKKFNPPTWEHLNMEFPTEESRLTLFAPMYRHIHRRKNDASWKGISILKFPTDLTLYAEAIHETKPEIIIEIGTKFGGSALYLQDMLEVVGNGGQVITIDIKEQVKKKDPRIQYWIGNSLDKEIIKRVKEITKDKKTMLIIDGNHSRKHVKWELHRYNSIVSPGQYMVVEDCYIDRGLYGPGDARNWFLERYKGFEQTNRCNKYIIGVTMGGWLKRV